MPLDNTAECRQAYADFLLSRSWDYFATVTFARPRRDTLAAIRDVDHSVANLRERAFWAVEPHRSGALHLHGLLKSTTLENHQDPFHSATEFWHRFFHAFGRSRVQAANSSEAVARYCAKYVTKSGGYEYDFTGNSLFWR